MDINEIARANGLTEDEKLTLEAKLLVATSRPLCLDPSPKVLAVKSQIYSERDVFNTNAMRRAIKRQSPVAASRRALKALEPSPPEFAFYDSISNSRHQKTTEQAASSLKRKLPCDTWRQPSVKLNRPFSTDVSKLAKPVEPDGQEMSFIPELLQQIEIKLDPNSSRGETDSYIMLIYRRPSDGHYSAVVKCGQDSRYSESQSAHHPLGQYAAAQKYLDHFLATSVQKAPLKSITSFVDGKVVQRVGRTSAYEVPPCIKRSKVDLALIIPKTDISDELQQPSDLVMSPAMASFANMPNVSFLTSDLLLSTSQPTATQCQLSLAKAAQQHPVPAQRASTQNKEAKLSCPTRTPAVQKLSTPQTRSGGRKGNPASLRSRRSSVPARTTKVQTSSGTGVWPGMKIMVSASDASQNSTSSSSVSGTGHITVKPTVQATSGQPGNLTSSSSTSSILVNPVGHGSVQTGSHMVMSSLGLQPVSRLVGVANQLTTVVVPAGSANAGVSSFPQPATQQKPSGSDPAKTRSSLSYETFTAPVSVLTTTSAKTQAKSAVSAPRLASPKQTIHPATVNLQIQPLTSTVPCSAQQVYLNSVAAGTTMALAQQGAQLQLVQSQQGQPIVLPASAKPVVGQQRSLGQSILVPAPATYHTQGQLPVQTLQFLSQQLNVPRQKLLPRSLATSGVASTQKQTPAISHPVRFVLTPGQSVPHMKQVLVQLQPTFGRMAQPSTAPQQQQAQHVVPHTVQSVALPAQSLVFPLQITTPSSSTPSVTTTMGKPS